MKRYIVFVILLRLMLSGCGVKNESPAATAGPDPTELTEALPQQVVPLPRNVELSEDASGSFPVSLGEGAVYVNKANMPEMKATVYDYELYDKVAMEELKVGDSILRLGQNVPVSSIESDGNGDIVINGGLDMGGHVFRAGADGDYYEISYNDAKSYTPVAEVVLPVADEFFFVDKSDFDGEPQTYYLDTFFVDGLFGWYFFPSNTTIELENGVVVSMERIYIP